MMIGPAPMMRMVEISVRLGMGPLKAGRSEPCFYRNRFCTRRGPFAIEIGRRRAFFKDRWATTRLGCCGSLQRLPSGNSRRVEGRPCVSLGLPHRQPISLHQKISDGRPVSVSKVRALMAFTVGREEFGIWEMSSDGAPTRHGRACPTAVRFDFSG